MVFEDGLYQLPEDAAHRDEKPTLREEVAEHAVEEEVRDAPAVKEAVPRRRHRCVRERVAEAGDFAPDGAIDDNQGRAYEADAEDGGVLGASVHHFALALDLLLFCACPCSSLLRRVYSCLRDPGGDGRAPGHNARARRDCRNEVGLGEFDVDAGRQLNHAHALAL